MDEVSRTTAGIIGTILSATGAALSVNDLQAIISIIVTIVGFLVSIVIPAIIKLVRKIKAAKEDGKITSEEMDEIIDTTKEVADDIKKGLDDLK